MKTREISICYCLKIVIVAVILLASRIVVADELRIAVLYPESTSAYEHVFISIVDGIKDTGGASVISRVVSKEPDTDSINRWLKENRVQSVIALGSVSYRIRDKLPAGLPLTVGAMVLPPEGFSGISLAADPAIFFDKLRILSPSTKRVYTVYSDEDSGWLMEIARKKAASSNIELIAFEANNLKAGLDHYDAILAKIDGQNDSIWMPLDRIVPDSVVLPKILKNAWEKKYVVFSNNPLHVKKGVLFALYPEHKKMGGELGRMAIDRASGSPADLMKPVTTLKLAVNIRTASHLGLHYSNSMQRSFDLIFPSE